MAGDISSRQSERIEILGELSGAVMVYEPMAITEIGLAGAQVETAFALQLDSLHDFRLILGDRSVVVKGRIVHSHVSDVEDGAMVYRAGVEFIEPSEHVLQAIGEFIDAIQATRSASV